MKKKKRSLKYDAGKLSGPIGCLFPLFSACALTACGGEEVLQIAGGKQEYVIVYDEAVGEMVKEACKILQESLGNGVALSDDEKKEAGAYEIVVGATNRTESAEYEEGLGEHDYRIDVKGEKLILTGGSDTAVINAIAALLHSEELVLSAEEGTKLPKSYSVFFDGADTREEYIENPDLFLCSWALEFDTPEWMLDFEEKLAAFADPDGRMMSCFHRGDFIHYPENSIEGIISAVKMGADNIEIDVQLTRDGIPVLMHDDTLNRTTDWQSKAGKEGLPESRYLSDWTYEELGQLRLNNYNGQDTDYKIPTLKEALQVCNGRTTIRLDKPDCWDWDADVYPLIQETGAWQTCILDWNLSLEKSAEIAERIQEESGYDVLAFYCLSKETYEDWAGQIEQFLQGDSIPVARWENFKIRYAERYLEEAQVYLEEISGQVRICVDAHILSGGPETVESYEHLREKGINFVLVDNGLKLQKYIVENFKAASYNNIEE